MVRLVPKLRVVQPEGYVSGVVSAAIADGKLQITGLETGTTIIGVQGMLEYQPGCEDKLCRYTQVKTLTVTTVAGRRQQAGTGQYSSEAEASPAAASGGDEKPG